MTFDDVPAELAAALEHARDVLGPFASLRYVSDVDSTNDAALTLAVAGAPEGASVLGGRQRLGRGRRGRTWFSPAGAGIYLSVLVRPPDAGRLQSLTTLGAGVAVARAVRTVSGLPIELKWPNDLVIGRPWRKLGGLLCEAATAGHRIDAVVIGVGVNLTAMSYPPELADKATSIEIELGRPVDAARLVVEILIEMRRVVRHLHLGELDAIRTDWRTFGAVGLGGAAVRWTDGALVQRGRARDIDTDGALLVDVGERRERLVAGEVSWELLSRE
jgi:BirA family transcriptional regulator, biotin operon repressor / biotin---[acetyl-CoA-carboxylase] ligase